MHQTMLAMLKALLLSWPPETPQDALHLVDDRLATTMYLMRTLISTVLKASVGQRVLKNDYTIKGKLPIKPLAPVRSYAFM